MQMVNKHISCTQTYTGSRLSARIRVRVPFEWVMLLRDGNAVSSRFPFKIFWLGVRKPDGYL